MTGRKLHPVPYLVTADPDMACCLASCRRRPVGESSYWLGAPRKKKRLGRRHRPRSAGPSLTRRGDCTTPRQIRESYHRPRRPAPLATLQSRPGRWPEEVRRCLPNPSSAGLKLPPAGSPGPTYQRLGRAAALHRPGAVAQ